MNNFIAQSICKPNKSKCGDASFSGLISFNGIDCILLMLADGVSTAPKDWLASDSTIQIILKELRGKSDNIPELLKKSIESANKQIYNGFEDTTGMLTTLSVVLIQPNNGKFWVFNIGDSRIYALKHNTLIQLSIDDSTNISFNSKSKIVLHNGSITKKTLLTNAIGYSADIMVNLTEFSVYDYEALVLASDGFYGLYDFEDLAKSLTESANLAKEAIKVKTEIADEITDDASFAVIRLPNKEKFDLFKLMNTDVDLKSLSTIAILNEIETELKQAILHNKNEYLEFLLTIIEIKRLYFTKSEMLDYLDLMIKDQSKRYLVDKITAIIRKTV